VDVGAVLLGGAAGAIGGAIISPLVAYALTNRMEHKLQEQGSKTERELAAYTANYESLLGAHATLAAQPEYLLLEGLAEDDCRLLKEAGVSCQEAAYLFMSFKASARWHRIMQSGDVSAYPDGHSRRAMLRVRKTRAAWHILQKLIGSETFKQRMNATLTEIERGERGGGSDH